MQSLFFRDKAALGRSSARKDAAGLPFPRRPQYSLSMAALSNGDKADADPVKAKKTASPSAAKRTTARSAAAAPAKGAADSTFVGVAKGREVGVFRGVDEALEQVQNYLPGAVFRVFKSEAEAKKWVKDNKDAPYPDREGEPSTHQIKYRCINCVFNLLMDALTA